MSLSWEKVCGASSKIFNLWSECGDFIFAKEAWNHLNDAGLTDDSSIIEENKAYLRLIALGSIYHDYV
jgi:hypothetical protein